MKTIEKILAVLTRNLAMTVVLVLAIVLFALFSDGLVGGIITAVSAWLAYACVEMLYKDFKKSTSTGAKKK